MLEASAGSMRMTADDDEQADQQLRAEQNRALRYLVDCYVTVSEVACRQHLHLARHLKLNIHRSTLGTPAFSVTGPMVWIWNSLPDSLRDLAVESERFR